MPPKMTPRLTPGVTPGLTPDRWRQVQAVFHDALERAAPERRAFLVGACGGDTALCAAVESMLAADEDASVVCGAVPASLSAVLLSGQGPESGVREGQRVGPYRLGE